MAQAGLNEHDATSVQVAVGEATSNAVEHAYVDRETGLVRLTAELAADGLLSVQVIDNGCWRRSGNTGGRGRGFPLMRAVMDHVAVYRRPEGTTVRMRLALNGNPA